MRTNGEYTPDAGGTMPLQYELATLDRRLIQGDVRGLSGASSAEKLHMRLRNHIQDYIAIGPILVHTTDEDDIGRDGITFIDDPDATELVYQIRTRLNWKEVDRQTHPSILRLSRKQKVQRTLASSALAGLIPAGAYGAFASDTVWAGVTSGVIGVSGLAANAYRHYRSDRGAERTVIDMIDGFEGVFISNELEFEYHNEAEGSEGGLHPGEVSYLKRITPRFYWNRIDDSMTFDGYVNDTLKCIIAADADPGVLWHERLGQAARSFSKMDEDKLALAEDESRYDKRTALTNIQDEDEKERLIGRRNELARRVEQEMLDSIHYAYGRWREQNLKADVKNMRASMTDAVGGAAESSPHFSTLMSFSNLVFDISLSIDADEHGNGSNRVASMQGYVKSMAELMDDDAQTKQFYDGFVLKFGEGLELPTWEEFENKYIINACIDR